jgi:hypothetical protein
LPVLAQEPTVEYGHPDELRGVTKVFVDTGIDVQHRDLIVKEIQKRLSNLEIVSRPEESDIHLRFSLKEIRDGRTEGVGTVVKMVGNNRMRVLLRFKDYTPFIYEPTASAAIDYARPLLFAREFVKTYKRVNG